jgi:hypothetical protein
VTTLTQARTALLELVDDEDGVRFNADGLFTTVDRALKTGQKEAWKRAFGSGTNTIHTKGTFTSSSAGVVDLTSVKPKRLVNVAYATGGQRLNVKPVRWEAAPTDYRSAVSLEVVYVPAVSFPASGAASFVWVNANVEGEVFEELMLFLAAGSLLPKEAVNNPTWKERKQELIEAVEAEVSVPSWSVMPLDAFAKRQQRRAPFSYVVTGPHTLQLVQV